MSTGWGPSTWGTSTTFVLSDTAQPRTLHATDRHGRPGRLGTLGLATFIAWMVGGRMLIGSGGSRPPLVLVGWQVILDMFELRGHALGALRLAVGGLWVAMALWGTTGGFRHSADWLQPVRLLVGLAGLAAVGPVLVVAAVLAVNLALWAVALVVGLLLLVAILLRVVTAPFRRW